MSRQVNVVALVKNNERYLFLFDEESRDEVLQTLGRFAANDELSFSWYDAAVLTQKVLSLVPGDRDSSPRAPERPISR
jgi:hypothetical protein